MVLHCMVLYCIVLCVFANFQLLHQLRSDITYSQPLAPRFSNTNAFKTPFSIQNKISFKRLKILKWRLRRAELSPMFLQNSRKGRVNIRVFYFSKNYNLQITKYLTYTERKSKVFFFKTVFSEVIVFLGMPFKLPITHRLADK